MGYGKWQAIRSGWRVPEANILFVAFIGGAFGIKIGQRLFRHKTRKQPLARLINVMFVWNAMVFGVFIYAHIRGSFLG